MIEQIQPAQLTDWINRHSGAQPVLVLDVREDFEVQTASIKAQGFELRHIPMGQLVQRLGELDPERPVACLCHHGGRSMQVASYLERSGFGHVANIAGGIHAWSAQVDATVPQY
jgi:rhodanese-related sulfurtransferase